MRQLEYSPGALQTKQDFASRRLRARGFSIKSIALGVGLAIGGVSCSADDKDVDGVPDTKDNCVDVKNADQKDSDMDSKGDLCDLCPLIAKAAGAHTNVDGDDYGDECDPCPLHKENKTTNDHEDNDGDGVGKVCDSDPYVYNPGQNDRDGDGIPDSKDTCHLPNKRVDADSDGHDAACDCDDKDASIHPGARDNGCDMVDSNCNGIGKGREGPNSTIIVEGEPLCQCLPGVMRKTGSSVGECTESTEMCFARSSGSEGGVLTQFHVTKQGKNPSPEECDSNSPPKDEDCDGLKNEEGGPGGGPCVCLPGQSYVCGSNVPPCSQGTQRCVRTPGVNELRVGPCEGAVGPLSATELCNNRPDDCRGGTDHGFNIGASCRGRGACNISGSTVECATPLTTRCSSDRDGTQDASSEELCDPLCVDEDCDGNCNEERWPVSEPNLVGREFGRVGEPCNHTYAGPGTLVCFGSRALECSSTRNRTHAPQILEGTQFGECNGVDDDFDGLVDEGCLCSPGQTQPCGSNVLPCRQGGVTCVNNEFSTVCGGPNFIGPSREIYDGVDNNCDTVIDNGPDGIPGQSCRGIGRCGTVAGILQVRTSTSLGCSTMPGGNNDQSRAEVINNEDDDCDGQVDEPRTGTTWPGTGLPLGDQCQVPGLCGAGTVVGDGQNATRTVCSSETRRTHHPGFTETHLPNQCGDGVDNDCDGIIDDGCECTPQTTRPCGPCGDGVATCSVNGRWPAQCVGGRTTSRELCGDGIDSDCDPQRQDSNGYSLGTSCNGVGACGFGDRECRAPGSTTTICSTDIGGSRSQVRPERCDGIDNDCDRETDEGFNVGSICVVPRRCGQLNGETRCLDPVNTYCHTDSSTVVEVLGDARDDNCNGDLRR